MEEMEENIPQLTYWQCCYKYCPYVCPCYNINKPCCYSTFSDHASSPYCITEERDCMHSGEQADPCCSICLTCFMMPIKFVVTFPCFFGSIFNSCVNKCRGGKSNYLC